MKRTAALCISLLLFPYLFTLAWTGRAEGMIQMESSAAEQRMVILDRGGNAYPVPVEDYIIGMAAMQIPADYEKETIKAQDHCQDVSLQSDGGGELHSGVCH